MGFLKKIFGFGKDFADEKDMWIKSATITTEQEQLASLTARQLAFEICVQRIAKAISKCEFRTYEKKKEKKNSFYYLLNVKPNYNQSSTEFWNEFIHKLYYEDEVLVVQRADKLFIADSFTVDDKIVFGEHVFKDIHIGDITLNGDYKQSRVMHFKLGNEKIKEYLDGTLALQTSLIQTALSSYKRANGFKIKAHIGRMQANKDLEDKINDLLNNQVKTFMKADNALLPEYEGLTFEEFGTEKKNVVTTRDIKALLDDTLELTCKAFLIPVNICNGDVADTSKAVDDFLTFCLDSIVKLIQDEINGKHYTEDEYLKGTYMKINTQAIKHIDALDMANSVDKLISSGVYSINNILRILGEEEIDEEWANEHYITKNYSGIDSTSQSLSEKGGKTNAKDEGNANANAS